jgi:hypothetical protein
VISVTTVIFPNDDGFVPIAVAPIPEVLAVTIPIMVTMNLANRHAMGPHTESHFVRSGRACAAETRNGNYDYGVFDHFALP